MAIAWRLVSIFLLMGTRGEPCTEYGCPGRPQYESFVPAPPGHTPNCAPPGQTFCETPDHYPRQLIKFLVDRCNFDFSTALRDESRDDFNSYSSPPDYNQGYDYPRQDDAQLYAQFPPREQPASIYGFPVNSSRHDGYKYSAPSQRDTLFPEIAFRYHHNIQQRVDRAYSRDESFAPRQPWSSANSRYPQSNKIAPRTYRANPLLGYTKGGATRGDRAKRQSNPDAIALCPTTGQFIAPRAALNNQGNWMYVVNIPEQNDKYSQLVRSEKCLNDECNGICSLPEGYRSKCEQQFVQKRLIALEGSGNRLYTDLFWLPHGCACQIIPNY